MLVRVCLCWVWLFRLWLLVGFLFLDVYIGFLVVFLLLFLFRGVEGLFFLGFVVFFYSFKFIRFRLLAKRAFIVLL